MIIVAVVVTFNRSSLLIKSLQAIESQTVKPDQVIVIDNHSVDDTENSMRSRNHRLRVIYERLPENIGGAGGFKYGMKQAYKIGANWLWCMDDDCIPKHDALEKLVLAMNDSEASKAGFLASRVLWQDGSPCLMNLPVAHSRWIEPHGRDFKLSRICGSSFVSILISRLAIDRVGYPIQEFFIWFDDAEYTRRIASLMNAYLVTDSVVVHLTPKNSEPLCFDDVDGNNIWKYCYGIRNECAYNARAISLGSAFIFLFRVIRKMARSKLSLRFWPALIKSGISGIYFNYTNYIELPSNK